MAWDGHAKVDTTLNVYGKWIERNSGRAGALIHAWSPRFLPHDSKTMNATVA
jgi:hypothetical protein